jgi:energy-coupling factor transport system ATP-binding protein
MSIKIENLTHIYAPKSPFEKVAIDNVSLDIKDGEFIALIGHTGSGKSTLIQHFNGLLEATSGKIIIDGVDITGKKVKLTDIRKKVGLVFQYPEYQIFEETIAKDIEFGPKNLGLSNEEIHNRVIKAMEMVGLDYETYKDRSPFDLSGGQKRRVAIAGVVAMEPTTLILDEPTAGLDPKGRDDILDQIRKLHKDYKMTIIIVSHSMEDVAKIAERIIVMNGGKVALQGTPAEVFKEVDMLEKIGLGVPQVTYLVRELRKKGFNISDSIFTIEEARKELLSILKTNGALNTDGAKGE